MSPSEDERLRSALRSALAGRRVLVMAVGNPMRADDGFGSEVAARLSGKTACPVIDAEKVPENFTGVVRREKPDVVLILDAADFDGRLGDLRLLRPEELSGGSPSTHAAGLELLFIFLRDLNAEWLVLAVQAGSREFDAPMTPAVAEAVERASELLIAVLASGAEAGGRA